MRKLLLFALCWTLAGAGEYYYINHGRRVALTPVPETGSAALRQKGSSLRFTDPQGREVTIGNRLIVKFKKDTALADYLNRYDLRVVKKYSFGAMYLLEAPDPAAAIEAANALAEMPDVLFAQPDIARKRMLR